MTRKGNEMKFDITGGIDPLLTVTLEKGEKVLAESNAMVAMDGNLKLDGKSRGGIMKSLARKFLNDETFFQQYIEADKGAGVALLAPNIPGDIRILEVGQRQYMISDGAFLAAEPGVTLGVKSQGLGRALLGDSGGFFVMATQGNGCVAVSGFGSVRELEVTSDKPLIVDNGTGLLGKLVNSQITGEGIVLKFRGEGKVLVCSRNKGGFLDWIFANSPTANATQNN